MRRVARWMLNALTVLSLLLCTATMVLCLTSYSTRYAVRMTLLGDPLELYLSAGKLGLNNGPIVEREQRQYQDLIRERDEPQRLLDAVRISQQDAMRFLDAGDQQRANEAMAHAEQSLKQLGELQAPRRHPEPPRLRADPFDTSTPAWCLAVLLAAMPALRLLAHLMRFNEISAESGIARTPGSAS